jgi:hypothetical protein
LQSGAHPVEALSQLPSYAPDKVSHWGSLILRQHVSQPGSSDERHPTLALAETGGQEEPPSDDSLPPSDDSLPPSDDSLPPSDDSLPPSENLPPHAAQGTRANRPTLATEYHSVRALETVEVVTC